MPLPMGVASYVKCAPIQRNACRTIFYSALWCQHFCCAFCRRRIILVPEHRCLVSQSHEHTSLLFCSKNNPFVFVAYPNSDAEFAIVEILFGLLQLLQFNAHEIHEYVPSAKHRLDNGKHIYIAVGLYRSAAYFNHNCYPAVVRYFVGTSIVLCTSHPIDVGDVVAENYGPNFLRQPLAERKRNLRSRYWFLCDCVSCNENWPTLSKLNHFARLKCPTADCTAVHDHPRKATKVFTCRQCKRAVNLTLSLATLKRAEDIYAEAAAAMEVKCTFVDFNTSVWFERFHPFYTHRHTERECRWGHQHIHIGHKFILHGGGATASRHTHCPGIAAHLPTGQPFDYTEMNKNAFEFNWDLYVLLWASELFFFN